MAERPISGAGRRRPNRIGQLLADRRALRCANRGDPLPLSPIIVCAWSLSTN